MKSCWKRERFFGSGGCELCRIYLYEQTGCMIPCATATNMCVTVYLIRSHNDIVDGDVNQSHKEAEKAHHQEANSGGERNFLEFWKTQTSILLTSFTYIIHIIHTNTWRTSERVCTNRYTHMCAYEWSVARAHKNTNTRACAKTIIYTLTTYYHTHTRKRNIHTHTHNQSPFTQLHISLHTRHLFQHPDHSRTHTHHRYTYYRQNTLTHTHTQAIKHIKPCNILTYTHTQPIIHTHMVHTTQGRSTHTHTQADEAHTPVALGFVHLLYKW